MSDVPFVVAHAVGSGRTKDWYHLDCLPEEKKPQAARGGAIPGTRCAACSQPILPPTTPERSTEVAREKKRARRTPDFRFKMREREGERKSEIGAGWFNDDGSISVSLNPGVKIEHRDCHDYYFTLFPIEKDQPS